jgi:hypothetical protein
MRNSRTIRTVSLLALLATLALSLVGEPQPTTAAPKGFAQPAVEFTGPTPQIRNENFSYYTLRADLRRCASPMCGGFFVKLVNHIRTRCADGRNMAECYVAEIDWNGQPSGETGTMLVRAELSQRRFQGSRRFGVLRVIESWRAASGRPPEGMFFRVKDLGIRCITHPCLTHQDERLNSYMRRKIAGVDLSRAQASSEAVASANQAMTSSEGVLVAGTHGFVSGPAGRAPTLEATQFYLRSSGPIAKKPCIKTGCAGQVCSDEAVITTCEWRREYECYRSARCERQASGECGFTPTQELTACLRRR